MVSQESLGYPVYRTGSAVLAREAMYVQQRKGRGARQKKRRSGNTTWISVRKSLRHLPHAGGSGWGGVASGSTTPNLVWAPVCWRAYYCESDFSGKPTELCHVKSHGFSQCCSSSAAEFVNCRVLKGTTLCVDYRGRIEDE